jgi:hypothetical protein
VAWAIATEVDAWPRSAQGVCRVHAYDLSKKKVPHPLKCAFTVNENQGWEEEVRGRRCQHCEELVGLPDK